MQHRARFLTSCLTVLVGLVGASAAANAPLIRLNTVGYHPAADKKASIAAVCKQFTVVRATGGGPVLEGTVTGPVLNEDTQEQLHTADFSAVREPGEYVLDVAGVGRSAPFRVATDVYQLPFRTVTRGMYLWRCGAAVSGEYGARAFGHGVCHTNDAWLDYVGGGHTQKGGVGGWHDAGDYNKYVVNAGVTLGAMFRAWEDYGTAIRAVALGLPEAGGSLPEFLAELKWEVDWLLTMQAEDGAVYHKLSTTNFGGFILPEQETAPRYFTPWSSAATADFVAMTAQAARQVRPYDAARADRYLAAARQSQEFLDAHPENHNANLTGFRTGGYGTRDADDRIWALAELWETTGEARFLADLEGRIRSAQARVDRDFDWGEVRNLGLFTYLRTQRAGRDDGLVAQVRSNLLATADGIVETRNRHGYGRPLGERYYWGCNGSVARQSLILAAALRADPKPEYRATALDGLNHLLGRNVHGRSYVTGLGDQPPMRPHDRRSGADDVEEPWPGYLVGGPNPKAADWRDAQEDYRSNEIAINWNGALIYALAMVLEPPALDRKPDVIYVPTPQVVVDKMLELAEVKPDDVVYDLGCGDGRIVVTAAKRYGVRAFGFDIDPKRVQESLDNVRSNKVEQLVTIRQADIFTLDLTPASVVTLYLLPELNVRLMPQLSKLRPGSRIVSHDFDMRGAKPALVQEVTAGVKTETTEYPEETHTVYKWIVPWEAAPQQ